MVQILVDKGLDIPIEGKPQGKVQPLIPSGEAKTQPPKEVALDVSSFSQLRFKLLAKEGEKILKGAPLLLDKSTEGRFFVAPASGVIKEIKRGDKRRLLSVVIAIDEEEIPHTFPPLLPEHTTRNMLIERLKEGGLFANISARPFERLADPEQTPKSIFVKAIESAPFVPPAELQVEGHEEIFQIGLNALVKLTDGKVHLVYSASSQFSPFIHAKGVEKHTVKGPHPAGNASLHIHKIDPISSADDLIWTLDAHDVVMIGYLLKEGIYFTDRIVSIAGPGIIDGRQGYFKSRAGVPIHYLATNRITEAPTRLISGDPLTGAKVNENDFLGFRHFTLSAIPEPKERELLHFFRLGLDKFSISRAYFSLKKTFRLTTSLHGEPRPFIDPTLYDEVMPLPIPTMHLVKAVMAEDFDFAEELGLLEVVSEDFALPTFVCPSKVEMTEIIKTGLQKYSKELLD